MFSSSFPHIQDDSFDTNDLVFKFSAFAKFENTESFSGAFLLH